jgi:hypothetical protein
MLLHNKLAAATNFSILTTTLIGGLDKNSVPLKAFLNS